MSGKIKLLFLAAAMLFTASISGCMTAGLEPQIAGPKIAGSKIAEPVAPDTDKAVIYVYRTEIATTATTNPGVYLNDDSIVEKLPQLNYFPLAVQPGTYTFSPKLFGFYKSTDATISAKAGQNYYVRLEVLYGYLKFKQVDEAEAKAYMATCNLINQNAVTDSRIVANNSAPEVQWISSVPQVKRMMVKKQNAKLYVKPNPDMARIRILNIKPKFAQGIALKAGRYHVEVTAPGYVMYQKWITLKAGKVRRLRIDLEAKKVAGTPKAVEAAPVAVATSSKINKPMVTKPAVTKPTATKASQQASAEEKQYADMFASNSPVDIRNAAKNLFHRYPNSIFLASAAEQCLLANFKNPNGDDRHSDAMAWICKALGRSGDLRFAATLSTVARTANNSKVRRHAAKSLNQLQ